MLCLDIYETTEQREVLFYTTVSFILLLDQKQREKCFLEISLFVYPNNSSNEYCLKVEQEVLEMSPWKALLSKNTPIRVLKD